VKEKENVIKYCRIKNAETAVTCQASSPRIDTCEFVGNGTAIKVLGAFSNLKITGNTIQKNKESAMIIASGAQPVLAENKNSG